MIKKNKQQMNKNKLFLITVLLALVLVIMPYKAFALLQLDNVQFDPAVITAGDAVDIVIQYHDEVLPTDKFMVGDTSYKFKVTLMPDDDLTKNYVLMVDSEGDDYQGTILSGGVYNKKFRVKINTNAPAADYEFKLVGQWYEDGEPTSNIEQSKFTMPVKKEGIIMGLANTITVPSEVRPGDNYVQVKTSVENAGNKDAKAIILNLDLPEGFKSTYADNNRVWVGTLPAGESKEVTLTINVDKEVTAGLYNFKYNLEYMDSEDNTYQKDLELPFLVRERPYLEVSKYEGSGLAGSDGELKVWVKNTGEEAAESVDVRIIKESSQPFDFDVRSQYIGDLKPGEEGLAIFDIKATSEAEIKNHSFKIVLRSKGDSDLDDNNVYTYTRRAVYDVTGKAPNYFLMVGVATLALFVLGLIIKGLTGKKKNKKRK